MPRNRAATEELERIQRMSAELAQLLEAKSRSGPGAALDREQAQVIVQKLKQARREQMMSIQGLVERTGLSRWTVRRLLSGRTFSWEAALRCAVVLRVEITLTATTARERSGGKVEGGGAA